ncbi:MAG: hypothetical protein IKS72_00645, partial [Prevotella sp.]|nr:hypothetical protein [Prevotella sp.]
RQILSYLNRYPILAENAHTRPFRKKWLNIVTGLILPVGLFFYLRMCRFRLRLHKDLSHIRQNNDLVIARIAEKFPPKIVTDENLEGMVLINELIHKRKQQN